MALAFHTLAGHHESQRCEPTATIDGSNDELSRPAGLALDDVEALGHHQWAAPQAVGHIQTDHRICGVPELLWHQAASRK